MPGVPKDDRSTANCAGDLAKNRLEISFPAPLFSSLPLDRTHCFHQHRRMVNELATELFLKSAARADQLGCRVETVADAQILDAGVNTRGSLQAGRILAQLCMGGLAEITLLPADPALLVSNNLVQVQTDNAVLACLGSQYAGWPVSAGDYFAMGSGPMRLYRGREETLLHLNLSEAGKGPVVGILESDTLPTQPAIDLIARECGVKSNELHLAVAPSTCIAGSYQVVARSIETAMHKLHALKFDVKKITSATGTAPLPPPAKPGDTVGGIGRTNDAMLYGATVTFWVDASDEEIETVASDVPSCSSGDYGRPFATIFKDYEYDFYKVDPLLFSPASVTIHSLQSGNTWSYGRIETDILRQSFISK